MKTSPRSFLFTIWAAAFLLLASPAHAHKVNMFASVEGDSVVVQGYFSDGKKALNSQVQVFGPGGEKLVEGTTDQEGMYRFKVPKIADLRITLYAGMGHRAEYDIPQAELAGVKVEGTKEGGTFAGMAQDAQAATNASSGEQPGGAADIPPDQLDAVVRKAVGEAMLPVVRSLSELKEARSFSDIVGGIGFIVGIIGIFFYVKARKALGERTSGGTKS